LYEGRARRDRVMHRNYDDYDYEQDEKNESTNNSKPVTLNNPLNNPDFRPGPSRDRTSNSPPIEGPFPGPPLPPGLVRIHLPLPCAVTPVNESFKIEPRLANRPSGPRCRAPFYSHARNS